MPRVNVRIRLEGRAVDIALSPARVILEHAELGPPGSPTRIVTCTVLEARALLDHFSDLAGVLTG